MLKSNKKQQLRSFQTAKTCTRQSFIADDYGNCATVHILSSTAPLDGMIPTIVDRPATLVTRADAYEQQQQQ
jgi:hypothetical protein